MTVLDYKLIAEWAGKRRSRLDYGRCLREWSNSRGGGREEGLLILMSHGREREGERRRGRDIRRVSKAIRCRYRLGILESAARYELRLRYELKTN